MDIAELTRSAFTHERMEFLRQAIKWTVYSLLIINWGYYAFEEWHEAQATLVAGDSILEWMNVYATSIDELGWFVLLFIFEAETYWLSEEALTRLKRIAFMAIRFICYGFLLHTMYAYWVGFLEFEDAVPFPSGTTLCDLVNQDFSFLRNVAYTTVDAANCGTLSTGVELFQIGGDQVVTDASGLALDRGLAIVDIIDVTTWLAVVLLIELVVNVQERGVSEGPFITYSNYLTMALYAVLIFDAIVWAWADHYVYAWDQFLWIGGFAAIEMNLSEWRDDMEESAAPA